MFDSMFKMTNVLSLRYFSTACASNLWVADEDAGEFSELCGGEGGIVLIYVNYTHNPKILW